MLWNFNCQNPVHLSYNFWLCDLSGNWSKFNLLTPVPDVTGCDKRWPSFHFWRHHHWPKLISSILKVCRRKIHSNDAQFRVIGSVEPEICTKMLKKLSEELRAKFPATARGYSMAKIARLDDTFSEFFELEASPVEGQSLQQKEKTSETISDSAECNVWLWCSTHNTVPI